MQIMCEVGRHGEAMPSLLVGRGDTMLADWELACVEGLAEWVLVTEEGPADWELASRERNRTIDNSPGAEEETKKQKRSLEDLLPGSATNAGWAGPLDNVSGQLMRRRRHTSCIWLLVWSLLRHMA